MIKLIKKIIPEKYRVIYREFKMYYWPEMKHFLEYSNVYYKNSSFDKIKGLLTMHYHVIEKGLTMPNPRLGFAKDRIKVIIELCNFYLYKGYKQDATEFKATIEVLREYYQHHIEKGYEFDSNFKESLENILKKSSIESCAIQINTTPNEFFKEKESEFITFGNSRRTCRHFAGRPISKELLIECIEFAQNTPSACNTQTNRCYIVQDEELKVQILALQNGNRGFGHLAQTLIVLSSDISARQGFAERHAPYFDSGMFAMNLLYVLHKKEIAACPLNWNSKPEDDMKIKELLKVPAQEVVTLVIACGYPPEKFRIASSPRMKSKEIINIY